MLAACNWARQPRFPAVAEASELDSCTLSPRDAWRDVDSVSMLRTAQCGRSVPLWRWFQVSNCVYCDAGPICVIGYTDGSVRYSGVTTSDWVHPQACIMHTPCHSDSTKITSQIPAGLYMVARRKFASCAASSEGFIRVHKPHSSRVPAV